jgi:asparaginyl-tRNA synthetase
MTSHLPPSPRAHLENPATRAALAIQHTVLVAARRHVVERGYVELLPQVIGPVTDPGARGAKQVDIDYYGHRYKLMTSAILYKQASLTAFDKIFYVAPCVRLEPPVTTDTRRHLAEFHQFDVEIADGTQQDAMQVAQDIVVAAVQEVLARNSAELAVLGRDPSAFNDVLAGPFDQRTHAAAVVDLIGLGHRQNPDAEIDWVGEEILSQKASRPVFLTNYPKGSRGFYDREDVDSPGVLRNFDLIAPGGYGELISGSEREFEYARIVTRMRETGENPAKYGWYLSMARNGIRPSAGFGIGIQRLTRFIAGVESVWQATAYPKIPGIVSA